MEGKAITGYLERCFMISEFITPQNTNLKFPIKLSDMTYQKWSVLKLQPEVGLTSNKAS